MIISLLTVAWVTVTTLSVVSLLAALLTLACLPVVRSVTAVMTADAFLAILLYPLLGTVSGAAAGAGASEVQDGRVPGGLSLITDALLAAMVAALVVTAVVRRRASREPIEPESFAGRQRDQRDLAGLRALSGADRAYFAERVRSWTAQADALRAEARSRPARGSRGALPRRWHMAAWALAGAGMALTLAVAIRYDAAWPLLALIACLGPPATVPVLRLARRRDFEIAARRLCQDADAITRQMALLPDEIPPRPRRGGWLRPCVLLGASAATAYLATARRNAPIPAYHRAHARPASAPCKTAGISS